MTRLTAFPRRWIMWYRLLLEDVRRRLEQAGSVFELRVPYLHVRAGEVVAIVGDSGCGKSTLLGLRHGTINTLRDRLVEDPVYREIRPAQTYEFDKKWFVETVSWPEVGFVIPTVLPLSSVLHVVQPKLSPDVYEILLAGGKSVRSGNVIYRFWFPTHFAKAGYCAPTTSADGRELVVFK